MKRALERHTKSLGTRKEPTVDEIHKVLKGGSNQVIFKVLQDIEAENADTVILSQDLEEDKIIKEFAIPLVEDLYNHCKKRANDIARAQYRNFSTTYEELDKKIKRLDEIEEHATDKITAAEAKRGTAIIKAEALALQLQSMEKELRRKDDEIVAVKQQMDDAITTLKQQKEAEITALKQQMEVEISVLNQQIKELRQAHEGQLHTNQMLEKILTQVTSNPPRARNSSKKE